MSNDAQGNDPLDFMKGMWGNMGFSLPGMVTPTFDVDEIENRIHDLKAVEGWLRMNLSMLQMTIQNLEMQRSTLSAVRAMGQMAAEQRAAASGEGQAADGANAFAQAAMWPWNMMQQHYGLYGEFTGVRSARKHIGWALRGLPGGEDFRQQMNGIDDAQQQAAAVADWFDALADRHTLLPTMAAANDGQLARQA